MNTCHLGFHSYGKWEDMGEVETSTTHLPTGTTRIVARSLIQKKTCTHCARIVTRRVKL